MPSIYRRNTEVQTIKTRKSASQLRILPREIMNLSMSLVSIISQQLIPNIENGRSLALEILVNTPSIKALIRENNIHQIDNYILSGAKDGMIRMDDSILALYNDNLITKENALYYAHKPSELSKKLTDFN